MDAVSKVTVATRPTSRVTDGEPPVAAARSEPNPPSPALASFGSWDLLWSKGRYADLVREIAAEITRMSESQIASLGAAELLHLGGRLYTIQHRLVALTNRVSLVDAAPVKEQALALLRRLGPLETATFLRTVELFERGDASPVRPWMLFRNTLKRPGFHSEADVEGYYLDKMYAFLRQGGDLAQVKTLDPVFLEGLKSGELCEWVVTADDVARIGRSEVKVAPNHTILSQGKDVLSAGSLRAFKNARGDLTHVVVGTFSGHFRTTEASLQHMVRHLVAAGVDPKLIAVQEGEAASPRALSEMLAGLAGLDGAARQQAVADLLNEAHRWDPLVQMPYGEAPATPGVSVLPAVADPADRLGAKPLNRRARIMATLAPDTSLSALRDMIAAGMDVARVNLAHGTLDEQKALIARIRAAAAELGKPITVSIDLPGPKIRLGKFKNPDGRKLNDILLTKGSRVTLTTADVLGTPAVLPVDYPTLGDDLRVGQRVFMNDGTVELKVLAVNRDAAGHAVVDAEVVTGGKVWDRKGLNLPDSKLSAPTVPPEDVRRLEALAADVDMVAISFVRSAEDVLGVQSRLARLGRSLPVTAKIERREAMVELNRIARVADVLMVARGDLGVEIGYENVPAAERRIHRAGNEYKKPTIVATEVMPSMIEQGTRPSRAEVEGVYAAVHDYDAECVMLARETSFGRFAADAIRAAGRVIERAERDHVLERAGVTP